MLAGILEEMEPGPSFSQMVHDHLSFLLKDWELLYNHKTPTNQEGRSVYMPRESTLSVLEDDQLLNIANEYDLKSMFETILTAAKNKITE